MPAARAVLLEPAAVAVHAVLKRPAGPGARVLVVGAGSIGLLVVAALRALRPDAEVHCVARHAFQAARAARMGAAVHTTGSHLLAELADASGARTARGMLGTRIMLGGFDLVVDTVGSPRALSASLRWVRAGGAVLAVGAAFRPGRMDVSPLWHQEVELVGVDSHGVEADGRSSFDIAAGLLARPGFPADDLVTHRFPLERWREAVLAFTEKRASGAVKVVLEPQA
jgi:threonine dehydrogenase-like Zn-dependent dehydrogenase